MQHLEVVIVAFSRRLTLALWVLPLKEEGCFPLLGGPDHCYRQSGTTEPTASWIGLWHHQRAEQRCSEHHAEQAGEAIAVGPEWNGRERYAAGRGSGGSPG